MWKTVQLAIILPIVWSNLVWNWTTNGYLPVLIGVMFAYVVSRDMLRPAHVVDVTAKAVGDKGM